MRPDTRINEILALADELETTLNRAAELCVGARDVIHDVQQGNLDSHDALVLDAVSGVCDTIVAFVATVRSPLSETIEHVFELVESA